MHDAAMKTIVTAFFLMVVVVVVVTILGLGPIRAHL